MLKVYLRKVDNLKLNKKQYKDYKEYPERIIQFGEGNFLRGFADWIIDKLNKEAEFDSSVLVVQPRNKDRVYKLNEQDGLYTLFLNGIDKGEIIKEKEVINCINRGINTYKEYNLYLEAAENPDLRFVISNTTEAGIAYEEKDKFEDRPQSSFPGKLARFLYHRYDFFEGAHDKGMLILPCELIDNNGDALKEIILKLAKNWNLEKGFIDWINNSNIFYNTLVDRIVTGYPKENILKIEEELGYKDDFLVEGESFYLWVIEGPKLIKDEFPTEELGMNVLFVDKLAPYSERKVRILNGAHTSMVPVSYLYGLDTVRASVEDDLIGKYVQSVIYDEIVPTLDLSMGELMDFASSTIDRFKNPFINHYLIDISLNSMSKFKTRVLPSIIEFQKRKKVLPENLVFSLASLMYFYKGDRNGEKITISDDNEIIKLYDDLWNKYDGSDEYLDYLVKTIFELEDLWEMNLNDVFGLRKKTVEYLANIKEKGIKKALEEVIS